jgi:predicted metal-dependent enzyme (double-stranded beta helix superfamily)
LFTMEQFISRCLTAARGDTPAELIAEIVRDAVAIPHSFVEALGEPGHATINKLYVSDELTILDVIWPPKAKFFPHNHNTWAVIGVYQGREENVFWRRIKDDSDGKIEVESTQSVVSGEVVSLSRNLIHSVTNPLSSPTRAIHVYGGNFFALDRSEWNPTTLIEQPYDVAKNIGR